jgi:hypothetical protein
MFIRHLRWSLLTGLLLAGALTGTPPVLAQILPVLESAAAESGFFGRAIAIGDVTGDRLPELVVGAPRVDSARGRVYVFDGQTRALLHTLAPPDTATCDGPNGCAFGVAVAIGDVTGDGHAEVVVSAQDEDIDGHPAQGRVYVFTIGAGFGGRPRPALLLSLTTPEPHIAALFGSSVTTIDVNGDGRRDVVVGAESQMVGDPPVSAGAVFGFDGVTGMLLATYTSPLPETSSSFGRALAVGNIMGEAREELIVGAPGETVDGVALKGRVYLFTAEPPIAPIEPSRLDPRPRPVPLSTNPVTVNMPGTPDCTLGPLPGDCGFGHAVSTADVDDDGRAEIIVGAPQEDIDGVGDQGRVYVMDWPGVLRYSLTTPQPNRDCARARECNRFGVAVAGGDINADGHADVIVGANAEPLAGLEKQGRAYVFSGRDGALLWRLDAPYPSMVGEVGFGSALAVGDLDRDKAADLAIGAFREWVGAVVERGRVYPISGQPGLRTGFETPTLGSADRRPVDPYEAEGVQFTAEAPRVADAAVGVVKNSATRACVEPADTNQKLGTGRVTLDPRSAVAIGHGTYPIRATFTRGLAAAAGRSVTVQVEFQTIHDTTVRLRLFDRMGRELVSASERARFPENNCGLASGPHARQVVSATTTSAVAYALMDVQPAGTVFVIDNVGWTP